MTTFLSELHLWTVEKPTTIQDVQMGCIKYHTKSEKEQISRYSEDKQRYTESRDSTWIIKNKRPEKLRDNLKEFEELILNQKCLYSEWISKSKIQIFFSNGVLVSFLLSRFTGDVDRIFIDKSLVGRLSLDCPNKALFLRNAILITFTQQNKLEYVLFNKLPNSGQLWGQFEKINNFEPKVFSFDLPGPVSRKLDRKIVCNVNQDLIIVWWPIFGDESWPWTPLSIEDRARANITLLNFKDSELKSLTFTRSGSNPLFVSFSVIDSRRLLTVEESVSGNEINADLCYYENSKLKLHRILSISIPLNSSIVCCSQANIDDKLIFGTEDGSLILHDFTLKSTKVIKLSIKPYVIKWHPSDTFAAVACRKGNILLVDLALSLIALKISSDVEDNEPVLSISSFFRSPPTIDEILWCPSTDLPDDFSECVDHLMLVFEKGPVAMLQLFLGVMCQSYFSPLNLVNDYLNNNQHEKAVNILTCINWNDCSELCYSILTSIFTSLLRLPLNIEREALLEKSLGTFYSPSHITLLDVVILDYRDKICFLARKFFHCLLRYSRFEKAFLLAVDIGARDLFMDLYYIAMDKGETSLAIVAREKVKEIIDQAIDIEDSDSDEDVYYQQLEEIRNSMRETKIGSDITQEAAANVDPNYSKSRHLHNKDIIEMPELALLELEKRILEDSSDIFSPDLSKNTSCTLNLSSEPQNGSADNQVEVVHLGAV